jgi:hypothetical protein
LFPRLVKRIDGTFLFKYVYRFPVVLVALASKD